LELIFKTLKPCWIYISDFLSFFLIYIPFIFFALSVIKTSGSMHSMCDESEYLCLLSDLKGKISSVQPLSIMWLKDFYRCFFQI
jgi:hypothetical protein